MVTFLFKIARFVNMYVIKNILGNSHLGSKGRHTVCELWTFLSKEIKFFNFFISIFVQVDLNFIDLNIHSQSDKVVLRYIFQNGSKNKLLKS